MKLIRCHPNPHTKALLTGYLHDEDSVMSQSRGLRPAVLVCPGGGYELWFGPGSGTDCLVFL